MNKANKISIIFWVVLTVVCFIASISYSNTTDDARKNSYIETSGGHNTIYSAYFDNRPLSWEDIRNGNYYMAREYSTFDHDAGVVRELQKRLNIFLPIIDPAYGTISVNGLYGTPTQTAVKKFRDWYTDRTGDPIDEFAYQRLNEKLGLSIPEQIFGEFSVADIDLSLAVIQLNNPNAAQPWLQSAKLPWSRPVLPTDPYICIWAKGTANVSNAVNSHPLSIYTMVTRYDPGVGLGNVPEIDESTYPATGNAASSGVFYDRFAFSGSAYIKPIIAVHGEDDINEFAIFEYPETPNSNYTDGNDFRDIMLAAGYVCRGYGKYSTHAQNVGKIGGDPITSKELIQAGGVEEVVFGKEGFWGNHLIYNPADYVYYSGHGYPDGSLGHFIYPEDLTAYWPGSDIKVAIFSACYVLDISEPLTWRTMGSLGSGPIIRV